MGEPARRFDPAGDRVLTLQAVKDGEVLDLSPFLQGEELRWDKPAGAWELQVVAASRNTGFHRDYINMLDKASVRLLLEAVYEPHWQRYSQEFGKTLAGFFSDEPNLGNGPTYTKGNTLGCGQDLPWSRELESALEESWGPGWRRELPRLFSQDSSEETARFHTAYMDLVTKLVREDFSQHVADWCHQRGVAYIGHVIEDDGQHCRTGSSLGHFFRGLQGQDMAGIDDIGGQVLPQGEDGPTLNPKGRPRNGEFYHYGLGTLAASSAALEPGKAGNAMCEIFGNYGWQEGVRLEKYLADHFLVRGINYFVPHAFTGHPFPDPDCPPRFYAQGHNPQYRHFGKLLQAMNRVATVTSSGPHRVEAAVLYHGESEWCDPQAMAFEHALRPLYDQQIHCHVVPADVFAEPERYHTQLGNPLVINGRRCQAFVVPGAKRLPAAAAAGLEALVQAGLPVFFAGEMPLGLCEGGPLPSALEACPVLEPAALPGALREAGVAAPAASPACDRLRLLVVEDEAPCVVLSNEGTEPYVGTVSFPGLEGPCFWYDPWHNRCQGALSETTAAGLEVQVEVEPLQLRVLALGQAPAELHTPWEKGQELALRGWKRSLCAGVEYPAFGPAVPVELPDLKGREDILKVHAKKIKVAEDVDWEKIARMASGASGAELANIVNEAALRAVRDKRRFATQADLEESIEVVIAGYQKKNAVLSDHEKRVVSYHEIGHALVAALQTDSAPVQKITIIPRTSGALGYTMQVDEEERLLMTREQILDKITTFCGGRAAVNFHGRSMERL